MKKHVFINMKNVVNVGIGDEIIVEDCCHNKYCFPLSNKDMVLTEFENGGILEFVGEKNNNKTLN